MAVLFCMWFLFFILFYLPAIPGLTAFLRLQLLKIILCTSCLLRIGEQLNHLVIYLNCILAVAFFLICISQNIESIAVGLIIGKSLFQILDGGIVLPGFVGLVTAVCIGFAYPRACGFQKLVIQVLVCFRYGVGFHGVLIDSLQCEGYFSMSSGVSR